MKKRYRIKAFTLLELIIAVSVAAIAAAVAIPVFNGYYDKLDENAFRSQCNNIKATATVMAQEGYKLRGEDNSFLSDKLSSRFEGYKILAYAEKGRVLQMEIVRDKDNQTMYYTDDLLFVREKPKGFMINSEGRSGKVIVTDAVSTTVPHTALPVTVAETTVTTTQKATTVTTTPEATTVTTTPEATTVTTTPEATTVTTTPEATTVTTTPEATTVTTTPETTTVTTTPETTTVTTTLETTTVTPLPETTTVTTVPVSAAEETSAATTVPDTTAAVTAESEAIHGYSVSIGSDDLDYDTWIDVSKYGNPKLLEWLCVEFEKSNNVSRSTIYLGGYNPNADVVTDITGYDFFDTEGIKAAFDVDQTEFETAPRYIKIHDWNENYLRGKITSVKFRFRSEPQFTPQSGSVKLGVKDISAYGNKKFEADLSEIADKSFKSVTVEFENIGYKRNGQVIINNGQSGSFNMKYPDGKSITVPASAGENSNSLIVEFYWCPDPTDLLEVKNVYLNYNESAVTEIPAETAASVTVSAEETAVSVTTAAPVPVTTEVTAVSVTDASDEAAVHESNESANGEAEYDTWIDISRYGDPKLLEWIRIDFEKSNIYSQISVNFGGYNRYSDEKTWVAYYTAGSSENTFAEFNVDQTNFGAAPRYMKISESNPNFGRGKITGVEFRFRSEPQFIPPSGSVKLDVYETTLWGNKVIQADFSEVADKNFKSVTIEFETIGYIRNVSVAFAGDQKYSFDTKYSDGKAVTIPVTPAGETINITIQSCSEHTDTAVVKHVYLNYDN